MDEVMIVTVGLSEQEFEEKDGNQGGNRISVGLLGFEIEAGGRN